MRRSTLATVLLLATARGQSSLQPLEAAVEIFGAADFYGVAAGRMLAEAAIVKAVGEPEQWSQLPEAIAWAKQVEHRTPFGLVETPTAPPCLPTPLALLRRWGRST